MIKKANTELPKVEFINTDEELEAEEIEIIPQAQNDDDDDFTNYEPLTNDPLNSL